MTELDHSLDTIAGGGAQYDAGHGIGAFARDCFDVFVAMGCLYTPML